MQRFHAVLGSLFLVGLVSMVLSGSGPASNLIATAMAVLLLVGLVVTVVSFLINIVVTLARCIARDVVRAAIGPTSQQLGRPAAAGSLGGPSIVEQWCRQAGWLLISREGDEYRIRSDDHRMHVYVDVSYSSRFSNVVIRSTFPVRFPMESAASGVFARVTMRSRRMTWSAWHTQIAGRCEAWLYLASSLPFYSMNRTLFASVCEEMAGEIRSFHLELHERFAYTLGTGVPPATVEPTGGGGEWTTSTNTDIRHLEQRR